MRRLDPFTPSERSAIMRRVHSANTTPELVVRSVLHALGYRFRLHRASLPGVPDIVLPRHHVAILVHGCFWHRHEDCRRATTPVANKLYWLRKFGRTVARDKEVQAALKAVGWTPIVVWECETRDEEKLRARLAAAIARASALRGNLDDGSSCGSADASFQRGPQSE